MLPTWYVTACNEWNAQATPVLEDIGFRNSVGSKALTWDRTAPMASAFR